MCPLKYAIIEDHEKCVIDLLNAGADWKKKDEGLEIMKLLVDKQMIESLKLLNKSGANLNKRDKNGNNLLHRAARNGKSNVLGYLVDIGVSTS